MDRFFVFYDDDYPDSGGVGFESFKDIASATFFIEERIGHDPTSRNVDDYTVVEGVKLNIEPVQTVLKVKLGR